MKTVADVLEAFEVEALNAGLMRNTRKTYAATIRETTELYLHTSGGKTVHSPLDTAARNIIPIRKLA